MKDRILHFHWNDEIYLNVIYNLYGIVQKEILKSL